MNILSLAAIQGSKRSELVLYVHISGITPRIVNYCCPMQDVYFPMQHVRLIDYQ